MSPTELALYDKIQAFPLDAIDVAYPLSRRLARENRWTLAYATRTIEEYKKFVLLAMMAGHSVTPSEQIDQVWHLHLIYTRSYWDDFCGGILDKPFHHGPTQGGFQETSKYRDLYGQTLASYERIFGYAAPLDIWSPSDRRFGVETKVERVNVQQNWVIPKPSLPKVFKALPSLGPTKRLTIPTFDKVFRLQGVGVAIGLAITTSGCTKLINPLAVTGPEFLSFYFQMAILLLSIGYLWRWWARSGPATNLASNSNHELNPYELAYLNHGARRVVDLALTSLVKSNVITIEPEELTPVSPMPQIRLDPIDREVLNSIQSGMQLTQLRNQKFRTIDDDLRSHLESVGLSLSPPKAQQIRLVTSLIIWGLLGLGAVRLGIGLMNGRPVGFLIILMVIICFLGIRLFFAPQRTRMGDRVLQKVKARYAYLDPDRSKTTTLDPTILLVTFAIYGSYSLFGDPALATLAQAMTPSSSSSGGCSSGGCGGGCGG